MTSADEMYPVGRKRLGLIHQRVEHLIHEQGANLLDDLHLRRANLCTVCQKDFENENFCKKVNFDIRTAAESSLFVNCSGVEWVCKGRSKLVDSRLVRYNDQELMTKETYGNLIKDLVYTSEAKTGLYSVCHLNDELKESQPHMRNMIRAVELYLWMNYTPFDLKHSMFPVPPLGEELTDQYVAPVQIGKEEKEVPVQKAKWSNEVYTPVSGTSFFTDWERMEDLNKGRKRERSDYLSNTNDKLLLCMMDKLCTTSDPCSHCRTRKLVNPAKKVDCLGLRAVCSLRTLFLEQVPQRYNSVYGMTCRLMTCDNFEKYRSLLNEIFNLQFIERAMELKRKVDVELLRIHPHLRAIIGWYDALLYRYYYPQCWKNEYEQEEDMDDDDGQETESTEYETSDE